MHEEEKLGSSSRTMRTTTKLVGEDLERIFRLAFDREPDESDRKLASGRWSARRSSYGSSR